MFLGIALLVVPVMSYIQLIEMERLLIQGQQNAQLLMARGISTLFNNRDDLFDDLPLHLEESESLYAYPLLDNVRIDGSDLDWEFESALMPPIYTAGDDVDAQFTLRLGERVGQLYGYIEVSDDVKVYSDPSMLHLDESDHIRVEYMSVSGGNERISLSYSRPGIATAYVVQKDWRLAKSWTPMTDILSYVRDTASGYSIEFRIPLARIGNGTDFAVSFVDVDDPLSREIRTTTKTLPSSEQGALNLVVFRSAETMKLIKSLGFVDARIMVYDSQLRVRGESGTFISNPATQSGSGFDLGAGFQWLRPYIHRVVVGESWSELSLEESERFTTNALREALAGNPTAIKRRSSTGSQVVMAAYPIQSAETTLGAISVEQDIEQILSFQQAALRQVVLVSLVTLAIVLVVAVGFAVRLAYRIRKLRQQATNAIDAHGRLTADTLQAEVDAGDEIGDLARAIKNMLSQLHEHNSFIERIPRTLRHEINNPLNTLSTSLENLRTTQDDTQKAEYFESARRGLMRIGAIVQNLSDAASLEDSLTREDESLVDINLLLSKYVHNLDAVYDDTHLVYRGSHSPCYTMASDIRIEQMMDKLIDNAIDFHRPNTPIKIQLDASDDMLRISVANRGPILDVDSDSLFERLVSHRPSRSKLHFGLGLYVVRVIAEFHDGSVRALNLPDGSGVVFVVELPRRFEESINAPLSIAASAGS